MFIRFDALKQLKYVKDTIKWSLTSIALCLFNFIVFKLPSCAFLSSWFISFTWSEEPYDLKSVTVSRWSDLYFDTTLNLWSIDDFSAAFNSCTFAIIAVKSALFKLMKIDLLVRNLQNTLRQHSFDLIVDAWIWEVCSSFGKRLLISKLLFNG